MFTYRAVHQNGSPMVHQVAIDQHGTLFDLFFKWFLEIFRPRSGRLIVEVVTQYLHVSCEDFIIKMKNMVMVISFDSIIPIRFLLREMRTIMVVTNLMVTMMKTKMTTLMITIILMMTIVSHH